MLSYRQFQQLSEDNLEERRSVKQITGRLLRTLEEHVDELFAKVGIDVEFTKHFKERLRDPRNGEPITIGELANLFKKVYREFKEELAEYEPGFEAVMRDRSTNLNVPFAINWNGRDKELELVTKTIMRKADFKSTSPFLSVEELEMKKDRRN